MDPTWPGSASADVRSQGQARGTVDEVFGVHRVTPAAPGLQAPDGNGTNSTWRDNRDYRA